jgi:hypothetical protein
MRLPDATPFPIDKDGSKVEIPTAARLDRSSILDVRVDFGVP